MDTKWKKYLSWLCFLLGVSLLLTGGKIGQLLSRHTSPAQIADAFQADYQNTSAFRAVMEDYLSGFLDASRERPLDRDYDLPYREDESILYEVKVHGNVVWSNAQDVDFRVRRLVDENTYTLPAGYDFSLYFNGTDTLLHGGDDGDGPDLGWTLPGRQTPVLEPDKFTTIWLCAQADPTRGVLYNAVAQDRAPTRNQTVLAAMALALGLALLLCYLPLRRAKAEADQALAVYTGKVWFEFKLLFLLLALYCLAYGLSRDSADGAVYLLLGFWSGYLLVNDCRYGPRPWTHSAARLLAQWWRESAQSLPFRRRMILQGLSALLGTLPLAVLMTVLLVQRANAAFSYLSTWIWIPFLVLLLLLPLFWHVKRTMDLARDVEVLTARIAAVRSGRLDPLPDLPEGFALGEAAANLDAVGDGLNAALDARMKSERMKVELISNVSHDLKTPLTSIISYTELLKAEDGLPDHVQDYIRILDEKSQRLKTMVQDVFEVSKAATGALPVELEPLDLGKLIDQTLADMAEAVEQSGLLFKVDLPRKPVTISADGDRLYRVFQNLFQNALQYALPHSRVYVTLRASDGRAVATVKNISRDELPAGVDFTARFVRGDESRTDGGSGLGLAIASSFTAACGGTFSVSTDADLFTATAVFDLT